METTSRTIVKAVTWQALGLFTMTAISYAQSGSVAAALSIAFSASATGFVCFFMHEKLWNAISWGRRLTAADDLAVVQEQA